MQLLAFGLNHTSAPLAMRERLAFPGDALRNGLAELRSAVGSVAPEQALLSTCNRTELYFAAHQPEDARAQALDWLAHRSQVRAVDLNQHLYLHDEPQAVRHVFRVASGLDSMVLGEPQILGQLKQAAREAQEFGSMGTHLHHLFQRAFSVAKEVRTSTEIGAHSVSMAAAAVKLAQRIFGDLSQTKMLFIGAGEMIALCLSHFAAQKPAALVVANRTVSRGETLAAEYGGKAIALAQLPEVLHEFDIVVSCTASSLPILGLGLIESALKKRRHKPMFLTDLAVPRDIEAEVAKLDDAFLYTVDDLGDLVAEGAAARQDAVVHAEAIIDHGVQTFLQWKQARAHVPLIKALGQHAEQLQQQEVDHALKLLARGDEPEAVLRALAHGLSQKMLHGAYASLTSPDPDIRQEAATQVRRLFNLPDSL
ncbi:MAG: glutamyl-tRNA reductase [Burkholderiaceae bacterium]|jgi:glutamyl-tRNA reductase